MVFSFKVIRLEINQSYFFGQVKYKNREFKINIQNEMRGKILKLPFGFVPKKERMIVRFTGQDDLFVEDYLAYGGDRNG